MIILVRDIVQFQDKFPCYSRSTRVVMLNSWGKNHVEGWVNRLECCCQVSWRQFRQLGYSYTKVIR